VRVATSIPQISAHARRLGERNRTFYDGLVTGHAFSPQERQAVYRVISERRDMRRFLSDGAVPEDVLARLLQAAHAAPSVGLMQPWRFIRITDETLRRGIHALVRSSPW
jgi:5,6-dimethylbenzimidazole synthase